MASAKWPWLTLVHLCLLTMVPRSTWYHVIVKHTFKHGMDVVLPFHNLCCKVILISTSASRQNSSDRGCLSTRSRPTHVKSQKYLINRANRWIFPGTNRNTERSPIKELSVLKEYLRENLLFYLCSHQFRPSENSVRHTTNRPYCISK